MGAGANEEWNVLIDLNHLNVVPKSVRPLEKQLPDESRKLWEKVTSKLIGKEYGEANKYKQGIEQRQREEAAERKKKGIEYVFLSFSPFRSFHLHLLTIASHLHGAIADVCDV